MDGAVFKSYPFIWISREPAQQNYRIERHDDPFVLRTICHESAASLQSSSDAAL
jgi:hypothetical protein